MKWTKSSIASLSKDIIAIIFWTYLIFKVLIFDIDLVLISNIAPFLHELAPFKLLFFAACVAVLWLVMGTKKFLWFLVYVLCFPLIVILWKIPKLIFKNWSLAILISPAVFDILSSFKSFFISYTVLLLSVLCIAITNSIFSILPAMALTFIVLIYHLFSAFRKAYKATLFTQISKFLSEIKTKILDSDFFINTFGDSDYEVSGKLKSNKMKYYDRMSGLYTLHWGVEYVCDKIRDIGKSRKIDLYLVASWFWTVFLTTFAFSFEYYALQKIDPSSFTSAKPMHYISFLGFSFGKLTPSSISSIAPVTIFATALCYLELICALIILVILVFTILTAARERYKEDIEEIIKELGGVADVIQGKCQLIFNVALSEAEIILVEHENALVNKLRKMRGMPEIVHKVAPSNDGIQNNVDTQSPEEKGRLNQEDAPDQEPIR